MVLDKAERERLRKVHLAARAKTRNTDFTSYKRNKTAYKKAVWFGLASIGFGLTAFMLLVVFPDAFEISRASGFPEKAWGTWFLLLVLGSLCAFVDLHLVVRLNRWGANGLLVPIFLGLPGVLFTSIVAIVLGILLFA